MSPRTRPRTRPRAAARPRRSQLDPRGILRAQRPATKRAGKPPRRGSARQVRLAIRPSRQLCRQPKGWRHPTGQTLRPDPGPTTASSTDRRRAPNSGRRPDPLSRQALVFGSVPAWEARTTHPSPGSTRTGTRRDPSAQRPASDRPSTRPGPEIAGVGLAIHASSSSSSRNSPSATFTRSSSEPVHTS